MKKFFRWLPALLICTAMSVACSDDDTPDVVVPPTPGSNETEVRAQTEEGADIVLISKDQRKFEWQVIPRADCKSYRVDVKVAARVQNDLYEAQKTNPELTYVELTQLKMFANDGSGAGSWVGTVDGVSEPRDFSTDMTIFQNFMLPDMEYVIMVWGCLTDQGTNPAEYTELKVRTDSAGELIGNPVVAQRSVANTRKTQIYYTPNEDCAAFFYLDTPKDDVVDYLNHEGFSDATLSDVICSFFSAPATTAIKPIVDWGFNADPNHIVYSIAVAMDANYTRNPTLSFHEYHVLPKDPTVPAPEYSFKFEKCSSLVACFEITCDNKETMNAYYCLDPNDVGLPKNAAELATKGGWIVAPETTKHWQYVSPDTEYHILITARNNQSVLVEPMDRLPFCHTKPIGNFDQPKEWMKWSKSTDTDKTKFRIDFEPDVEKISCFFYCTLEKGSCYYDPVTQQMTDIDLTDPKNIARMRTYMINNANQATPLQGDPESYNYFSYTGLTPGKDYVTFVLAETWDGNFVDVQYMEVTTKENNGGPKPEITFGDVKVDEENMSWEVMLKPNDDVYSMRYCGSTETAASVRIDDYDFETTPDAEKLQAWTEFILGDVALKNFGSQTFVGGKITDNMLVIAIGVGRDEDGEDVYSKLAVMRLDYDTKKYEQLNLGPKAQEVIQKVIAKHNLAQKKAPIPAKPLPGYGPANNRNR